MRQAWHHRQCSQSRMDGGLRFDLVTTPGAAFNPRVARLASHTTWPSGVECPLRRRASLAGSLHRLLRVNMTHWTCDRWGTPGVLLTALGAAPGEVLRAGDGQAEGRGYLQLQDNDRS